MKLFESISSQSLENLQSLKQEQVNHKHEVKNLRQKRIGELSLLMQRKARERMLSLLTLKYYQELGITNVRDLSNHIATQRVRYDSKLSLKASAIRFYQEWFSMSNKKANDE